MTAYYLDTSALIKRYVDEVGSGYSPTTSRRLSSFLPMIV